MSKFRFDDEGSRIVEEFNASSGAKMRRACILQALDPQPGNQVLDVGCGPGNQVLEISPAIEPNGHVIGVDQASSAIEIAVQRCAARSNVSFQLGDALDLPLGDSIIDKAMSSQVFEYLDDVDRGVAEMFRVLKPEGHVLIHDTDWTTLAWHSSDDSRMKRIMKHWDYHLANPRLPQTLASSLVRGGFVNVRTEAILQLETSYDPSSVSALIAGFVAGYVVTQGISQSEAEAWLDDLRTAEARGNYFFSLNEYIFIAQKPS